MSARAALRFHLETAVRVILHQGPLQLLVLILALGLHPEPLRFLEWAARRVAGGGTPIPQLLLALWMVGTTLAASTRLRGGAEGWVLHLPVSALDRRRALVASLLAVQVLPGLAWLGLWVAGGFRSGSAGADALIGAGVAAVAAAYLGLPRESPGSRSLALAALVLGAWGGWPLIPGIVALGLLDRRMGRNPGRRHPDSLVGSRWSGLFPLRVASRAVGWSVLWIHGQGMFPVLAVYLALRNNPDLSDSGVAMVVRGGCGLAAGLVVLALAGRLASRRPVWAWSRSLPGSAGARILGDAGFLGLHAIPAVIMATLLHPISALPVLLLAGYLALRASGAMRGSGGGMTTLGWAATTEILMLPLLGALHPMMAPAFWVLAPRVWMRAVGRDQGQKVSLLQERRYLEVGDSAA